MPDMMSRHLFIAFLLLPVVTYALAGQTVSEPTFTVNRFEIMGEQPLASASVQELLRVYTGKAINISDLQSAAKRLEDAIKAQGYIFYRVVVPPQQPLDGVIQLKVLRFNINRVDVTGNKHFSDENIRASLPHLVVGESPNTRPVQRALQIANDHPAKRATIVMRQSREVPDAIDAELQVRDVKPQQTYVSLSNTGTQATGDYRLSFGYQHSNLFDRDHSVTLSYTTSPDYWSDVRQFGIFYRIPLYSLGGSLHAYYTDSSANSGTIDSFDVSGSGSFYGLQYRQALPKIGDYSHSVFVGLDDKDFGSDVTLLGVQIGVDVRSRPLTLGYAGKWKKANTELTGSISWFSNTGSGASNDDATYTASRAGADSGWSKINIQASVEHSFTNQWKATAVFQYQDTSDALISGEQFGLGGASTIRGFAEREIAGDRGHLLRVEVWAPKFKNNIQPFAFVDSGKLSLVEPIAGTPDDQALSSAGIGLTWSYKDNLNLRMGWATVLDGAGTTEKNNDKLHVNVFYRFD